MLFRLLSKFFLLCIWASLITLPAKAQNDFFSNFTVEDGLISDYVYDVLQDSRGYLWFATETGVSRFDGSRFENFTTEDGLAGNEVLKMFEDGSGRIWFLTYSSEPCFYHEGAFYNPNNHDLLAQLRQEDNVFYLQNMMEDSRGDLWLHGVGGNLYQVSQSGKLLNTYSDLSPYHAGRVLTYEHEEEVYLFTRTEVIEVASGELFSHDLPRNKVLGNFGKHWGGDTVVTHRNDSVYLWSGGKGDLQCTGEEIPLLHSGITLFERMKTGHMWIGTHRGVVEVDAGFNLLRTYLRDQIVSNVLEDREGNYWFTTLGGGVYFTPNIDVNCLTAADGLSSDEVVSLRTDSRGRAWIGFKEGRYDWLEPDYTIVNHVSSIPRGATRTRIRGFHEVSPGRMLVFGDFAGAYWEEDKVIDYYLMGRDVWVDTTSNEIYIAANAGVGVEVFDDRLATWSRSRFSRMITKEENAYVLQPYQGKLLVGGVHGLHVLQDSSLIPLIDHPALRERVSALEIAADGSIWVATSTVGVVHIQGQQVKSYNRSDGLADNLCKAMIIDSSGTVWVGTARGLCSLRETSEGVNIKVYRTNDGLASNEINALAPHNGKILVGTRNGLTIFDERSHRIDTVSALINVSRFAVNGEDRALQDHYALEVDENYLEIEFTSLSFRSLGEQKYRYCLVNLDDPEEERDTSWKVVDYRELTFPALPHGNYVLTLMGSNSAGRWGNRSARVSFQVEAPWHKKFSNLLLINLAIVLLMAWIFTIVLRSQRRKTRLLARVSSAEQDALRSQMNPHFIFNALNTIQRFVIENNKKEAYNYLEKFGSLIRNTLQATRRNYLSLQQEYESLGLYLELESLRFEDKFDYRLEVDDALELGNTRIPPMLIQPFVENAIRHGIMPRQDRGLVEVSFRKERDTLVCTVQDNGVGRQAAQHIKKEKNHNSIAMNLTTERLQLLSKRLRRKHSFEVIDLKDEKGNPTGTKVVITLPLITEFEP